MQLLHIVLWFMLFTLTATAQDQFITKNGYISFFSHTPVEDIEAVNNQVLSIVDIKTGEVAVSLLMKSFQFEKALMQEHFNENYIESDKYPKATFQGKIMNLKEVLSGEKGVATVSGELSIHGRTNPLTMEGKITISDRTLRFEGSFMVTVADYDIKIPSIVARNIAREVRVTCILDHHPYP